MCFFGSLEQYVPNGSLGTSLVQWWVCTLEAAEPEDADEREPEPASHSDLLEPTARTITKRVSIAGALQVRKRMLWQERDRRVIPTEVVADLDG
eukprot:935877-Amphidinium_carterae.1